MKTILTLCFTLLMILHFGLSTTSACKLFNFGDSNTDGGDACSWLGTIPGKFNRYCRASDGYAYIDYLCKHLGIGLLNAYLDAVGSNFTNGANFAYSGTTASPNLSSLPLPTQVQQFARLKYRVEQLNEQGKGLMLSKNDFGNSVYSIDIGQNDLSFTISSTYQEAVNQTIPHALEAIEAASKRLYELGARKFLLYSTGPLGCLPVAVHDKNTTGMKRDQFGCVDEYNRRAREFNAGLISLSIKLRLELIGTMIVYMDMYTIKLDLIANASRYGFENPLDGCFNDGRVCTDPSRYVNWDGIHYSEAANKIVAKMIVSGEHATPNITFKGMCQLRVPNQSGAKG